MPKLLSRKLSTKSRVKPDRPRKMRECNVKEMLETFNSLPDEVKLGLLYKHNQQFRQALQNKVWSITQKGRGTR